MPGVVALPRQVVGTAIGLVQKAMMGAATSGYAKGLVTSFAEKVRVERVLRPSHGTAPTGPCRACRRFGWADTAAVPCMVVVHCKCALHHVAHTHGHGHTCTLHLSGRQAIVDEAIVKVEDVDVPFWAYWLSASGYTSHAGFKKFAEAAKLKVAGLEPQQVVDLTVAFQR